MSRLFKTALAAAAALGLAAPALAQDAMGTMPTMTASDVPWCSATVTDQCRQHEGMSGMMQHHGWTKHHAKMNKHHRMMHRHAAKKHHRMTHSRNPNAAMPAMPAKKM